MHVSFIVRLSTLSYLHLLLVTLDLCIQYHLVHQLRYGPMQGFLIDCTSRVHRHMWGYDTRFQPRLNSFGNLIPSFNLNMFSFTCRDHMGHRLLMANDTYLEFVVMSSLGPH